MSDKLPPGPWTWTYAGGSEWDIHDATGHIDCNVWGRDHDRAYAAVTAICAVPEMVAALDVLLKVYVALVNSGDAGNWNPENDDCVISARAALAKARKPRE